MTVRCDHGLRKMYAKIEKKYETDIEKLNFKKNLN